MTNMEKQAETLPPMKRFRYLLEAAGFFAVVGFFSLFPLDTASAIGGWIGRRIIGPLGMKKQAVENLRIAYPDIGEAETARILNAVWDNLGRVMAEYAHLSELRTRIELVHGERLREAYDSGKGALILSAHFANWEAMPIAGSMPGLTGGEIVRPPNNPYVGRWIEAARIRSCGFEQIPKGVKGTRRTFALLRKGQAILALVDQRTSEGIPVPFFDRPALTTPAPAALALKLGSIVVPATNERINGAHFRVHIYPPIQPPNSGDHEKDVIDMTTTITEFMESHIRARPEQWLWTHRRWTKEGAPLRKRAAAMAERAG